MGVQLRELTPEVISAVRQHVVLPEEQALWVGGSIDDILDEAAENLHGNPWPRAVFQAGEPVGFVMLSWDVEPDPPALIGPWFLWKLMVAPSAQGTGVGRAVIRAVSWIIREQGGTELLTSCAQGGGTPYGFYVGLGFVPTGVYAEDDEEILALTL